MTSYNIKKIATGNEMGFVSSGRRHLHMFCTFYCVGRGGYWAFHKFDNKCHVICIRSKTCVNVCVWRKKVYVDWLVQIIQRNISTRWCVCNCWPKRNVTWLITCYIFSNFAWKIFLGWKMTRKRMSVPISMTSFAFEFWLLEFSSFC